MHIPPPPPEFLRTESEYRRERRRSGSSGDPVTAFLVLFLYLLRLVRFLVMFPFKLLIKRWPRNVMQDQEQDQDTFSEKGTWKRRS